MYIQRRIATGKAKCAACGNIIEKDKECLFICAGMGRYRESKYAHDNVMECVMSKEFPIAIGEQ